MMSELMKAIVKVAEVEALNSHLSDWDKSMTYDEVIEHLQNEEPVYKEDGEVAVLPWSVYDNTSWQDVFEYIEVSKHVYIEFAKEVLELNKALGEE